MRSKKELIERFIAEHFPNIPADRDVGDAFEDYWDEERKRAIRTISSDEGLNQDGLETVIGQYLFTEKPPMRDEVIGIMNNRPGLRERGTVAERIIEKIKDFVATFIDGVD